MQCIINVAGRLRSNGQPALLVQVNDLSSVRPYVIGTIINFVVVVSVIIIIIIIIIIIVPLMWLRHPLNLTSI